MIKNIKKKVSFLREKKEKASVVFSILILSISVFHLLFIFSKKGELYQVELVNLHGIIKYLFLVTVAGIFTKKFWVIQQTTWFGIIVPYWTGLFYMHQANLETFVMMGIKFRRKFTLEELQIAAYERFGSSPFFGEFSARFKWSERAEIFDFSREALLVDIKEALRFYEEVFAFGETVKLWDMDPNHYQSFKVSLFFTGTLFLFRSLVWFYTFYVADAPETSLEERQYALQAACEIACFIGAEISLFEERGKEIKRNRVLEEKWFYGEEEERK